MSAPAPPSTVSSPPRPSILSFPAPPLSVSAPSRPVKSSAAEPERMSSRSMPWMSTLALVPRATSPREACVPVLVTTVVNWE
jgi:hypothetical protein